MQPDPAAEFAAMLADVPDDVAHEVFEVLSLLAGANGEGLEAVRARAREAGGRLTPGLVRAALEGVQMSTHPEWQQAAREAYAAQQADERVEQEAQAKDRAEREAPVLKAFLEACGIDADPSSGRWQKGEYTFVLVIEGKHADVVIYHDDMPDTMRAPSVWAGSFLRGPSDPPLFEVNADARRDLGAALHHIDEALARHAERQKKKTPAKERESLADRLLAVIREVVVEELGYER